MMKNINIKMKSCAQVNDDQSNHEMENSRLSKSIEDEESYQKLNNK